METQVARATNIGKNSFAFLKYYSIYLGSTKELDFFRTVWSSEFV